MLTSSTKQQCSRCKKLFDYIDANNHCIDCWEKLQYEKDQTVREIVFDCTLGIVIDVLGWIVSALRPRPYVCRCECNNYYITNYNIVQSSPGDKN